MQEIEKKKLSLGNDVPEGWKIIDLQSLCLKPIVYGIVQAGPNIDDGIPYIRSTDVGNEINVLKLLKTSKLIAKKYIRSVVRPGDIVFSLRGNIGETSKVPDNLLEANLTQGTARLSANPIKITPPFLKYSLSNSKVNRDILRLSKGSTFQEISLQELRKVCLAIPPLPEQQAIADCLSTWDGAIQATQQLIRQKELQKKWIMQQLLTGKKRLKGFSGEWREVSYSSLLKIVKRDVIWSESELYKLISVRRRSGGIFFREALFGNQIKVKNLRNVEVGDFLFSKMQIVHGASALVTNKFEGSKISGSYTAVIAKNPKDLNMEYFNWCSKLPYFYHQALISSYGVHIEKMTFNFESFLQLEMTLPSIAEQQAIASILSESDRELDLLRERLQKIREQKKGLMQVLLTGKKRIK